MTAVQQPFDFLLPESNWQMPTEFPDLVGRGAKYISLDLETCDPKLESDGPGFVRGDAFVAGVAIAADGYRGYFPVRHLQGQNLAPNVVFDWVSEQLSTDITKYGANLGYELEGLYFEGVRNVRGRMVDVQVAEGLIDEETSSGYSLEAIAQKYLGEGKEEGVLRQAAGAYKKGFKSKIKGIPFDPKGDLWKLPAQYVGAYAEGDVDRPVRIWEHQKKTIDEENLWECYNDECDLIPLLVKMRIKGAPVDLERAEKLAQELTVGIDDVSMGIKYLLDWHPNVDSGADLAKAYEQLDLSYPHTNKGNPSFVAEWLELQDDPLSSLVLTKRQLMTLRDDFVRGDIMGESINGRIHCQFISSKRDDGGTRTMRFSCKNPNLQQVPTRHPKWGKLIRALFVAEHGRKFFKGDFSQQEPRLTLHYAYLLDLPGAREAVETFRRDPWTDYHQLTTDMVNKVTGKGFKRKEIKGINLGIVYTMGVRKLARKLGITEAEAVAILADYHLGLPFVKGIQRKTTEVAEKRNVIRTLFGGMLHFKLWEPVLSHDERKVIGKVAGLPRAQAEARWPNHKLRVWGAHKALNKLIQGSAARQTKRAMLLLNREHDYVPSLQVHDELCDADADEEVGSNYKRTMEDCAPLVLPVVCDGALGPNWGEAKQEVHR